MTIPMAWALAATLAGAPDPLAAHTWEHRVLVLFADGAEGRHALEQQTEWIRAAEEGFASRDLVRVEVVDGERLGAKSGGEEVEALRERFRPEGPFVAILVGKDGGEKLRSNAPIEMSRLFRTIDAMPMRAAEMRARLRAGPPRPGPK